MPAETGFAFRPFTLDVPARRLRRDDVIVRLPARQFDLLHLLVRCAGEVIAKDALVAATWRDSPVGDSSLVQAISQLRTLLDPRISDRYIKTVPGVGYSFVAPVTRLDARPKTFDLEAILAPHTAWIDGRAALETLVLAEITQARSTFAGLLVHHGEKATVHVGYASACVLQFEATRADREPDMAALGLAFEHASEACRLAPDYGEAWATLGFVLERKGERPKALAALRRSVELEPDNWRHWLRLAFCAWGEERLRASRRVLGLLPNNPMAHWLVATVFVARQALGEAEREIDLGIQTIQSGASRFSVVALYWLKGLLCLARGAYDEALDAFRRELALEPLGHLYTRECCANTWYAIGVCHMLLGQKADAATAFNEAIARVSRHPMAHAGLAILGGPLAISGLQAILDAEVSPATAFPIALAKTALLVATTNVEGAARLVAGALLSAPPGNSGWLLPIEPLLAVPAARQAWGDALAELRTRAA